MGKKTTKKNKFGNSIIKNLIIIIITGVLLVIIALLFLKVYTRHGQNVVVPQLEGLQIEEARKILKSKGLEALVIDSIYKREAVPGSIIDQKPKANNKVKEGRSIYITTYAQSPQEIAIPSLVDFSERQAIAMLNSLGFTQIAIEQVPSEYAGLVMSVEYRGKALQAEDKVPAGSPLKIIVGSGMLDDSLKINHEYIVPPSQVNTPQNTNTESEENTGIDETFL